MFFGMKASTKYAHAAGGHVEARDMPHGDMLTGLMAKAFIVMFDNNQASKAQQRAQVEASRDVEFEQFVSAHGPFSRYIP